MKIHTINKMEKIKYHTDSKVPKYKRTIVERDKIDTPNTQIHDLSFSGLGNVCLLP